uniref:N-acetyltransferase domain-containing protein n=1 Tax=Noctiluca scintillans TaxID=2966 RepID=A0A7S1AW08_NOCSC
MDGLGPADAQHSADLALKTTWRVLRPDVPADQSTYDEVRRLGHAEFHEDVLEIVDSVQVVVLLHGVSLLGYVVFGLDDGVMALRFITVEKSYRMRGYGRQLINHVCRLCAEMGLKELSLFSERQTVPFYTAVGFREVPAADGESEDDLQVLMTCLLPGTAGRAQ